MTRFKTYHDTSLLPRPNPNHDDTVKSMFTGLIQMRGRLVHHLPHAHGEHLGLACQFENFELGESIAVNGVCLTVVRFSEHYFECDVSSETLRRTNLGGLRNGDGVNLERALRLGDRLGGHLVSGHVDGTGKVAAVTPSGESLAIRIEAPHELMRYVVEKGSIAIDGASLTVNAVERAAFEIMLIPHSQSVLEPDFWRVGRTVNIECDMIGKYVEKLLSCTHGASSDIEKSSSTLSMEQLRDAGFLGL